MTNSEIAKDLEEAAVNWICNHKNGEVLYVKDAFIAGAKWQYQKDRSEFAKIKLKTWNEGFDACMEMMMKGAIEYEVGMHGEPIEITLDKYVQRAREIFPGDKVCIIVWPKKSNND